MGRRLALGLFSVGGASVVVRLVNALVLVYAAQVVGPQSYGLYAFGLSVSAYAGVLLSPGILTWGTRAIARDPRAAANVYVIVIVIRLVLASIAYLGTVIATVWFSDPERLIVLLFGFVLLGTALNADWVLYGLGRMRAVVGLSFGLAIGTAIAIVVLVSAPTDVYRIPVITGASLIVLSLMELAVLGKSIAGRLSLPGRSALTTALRSSAALSVTSAIVVVLHYSNNLIVHAFAGATALGLFYAALRFFELVSTLPGVAAQVYLPRLSRLFATDPRRASFEAQRFVDLHLISGLLLAIVVVLEAPSVIVLLYGRAFAEAGELLRFMGAGLLFNYAIQGYVNVLIAFGRDAAIVRVVGLSALVSVIGGFIAIALFGILGSAIVIASIDLAGWLVALTYFHRSFGSFGLRGFAWPAVCGGVAALTLGALTLMSVSFEWRVPLASIVYLALILWRSHW